MREARVSHEYPEFLSAAIFVSPYSDRFKASSILHGNVRGSVPEIKKRVSVIGSERKAEKGGKS